MTALAVHAEQLEKAYWTGSVRTPVLKGVDLAVERGECAFLVGPSGSGKSTLLAILGCILSPDAGRLSLLGQDVTTLSTAEMTRFRRERIGFVFQQFQLLRGLRAWENVKVTLDIRRVPARKAKRRALELLDSVGLADRAQHRISQLSMGQRQRVALARALAGDPDLILADEPTASLDAETGRQAMHLLRRLCHEHGKTVVVVTHDPRILDQGGRVFRLVDGRIEEQSVLGNTNRQPTEPSSTATPCDREPAACSYEAVGAGVPAESAREALT